MRTENHPLVALYGADAFGLVVKEIKKLELKSNIPFDSNYVKLGMSFLVQKANEIAEGGRNCTNLNSLVSESFGEAAIYKYNLNDGFL